MKTYIKIIIITLFIIAITCGTCFYFLRKPKEDKNDHYKVVDKHAARAPPSRIDFNDKQQDTDSDNYLGGDDEKEDAKNVDERFEKIVKRAKEIAGNYNRLKDGYDLAQKFFEKKDSDRDGKKEPNQKNFIDEIVKKLRDEQKKKPKMTKSILKNKKFK